MQWGRLSWASELERTIDGRVVALHVGPARLRRSHGLIHLTPLLLPTAQRDSQWPHLWARMSLRIEVGTLFGNATTA